MINLLSTSQKEEIRAARLNVQLRKYVLLGACIAMGIFAIYGVGLYIVTSEKSSAQQQLDQNEKAASQYRTVQEEVKAYKQNLEIAITVLSSGTSYSTFIANTAAALPAGSVLTDLTLTDLGSSSAPPAQGGGAITLHARTKSYGGALEVKESLEKSDLFENVSITDITKTEITDESSNLEKKYPFTLNVNVVVTKQKVVL